MKRQACMLLCAGLLALGAGALAQTATYVFPYEGFRYTQREDETVLIQGIIDVYLEEEDGIVLADYKTDLVKDPKELILRYRVQLDYYEEALVRLTGKCVKEKLIYSFGLEQEITL